MERLGREEVILQRGLCAIYLPHDQDRAAERYAEVSPEQLARRRARGWGNPVRNNTSPVLPSSQRVYPGL